MLFLEQGRGDGQAVWQQHSTVNCIPVNKNLKIEPELFLEIWCNSYNFVMSAWPVPTYLDCTIESNNISN